MANVSSVVLNYAVRGADRAQRKDKQVRESIQRTGREARKQAGTIRRWMQRHQAAIAGIAAATAGAMMAIVRNSPTLRGELAGARLAFSLFAMTVGEDIAPALNGISDTLLDLQEAYANLDGAVRKPISALIGFSLAAGFVVTALGLLASELLGITNVTNRVTESQNGFIRALSNLVFFLLGPLIGALGVIYAFWEGGWSNAKRVALRFVDEIGRAFIRFAAGLGAGIYALAALVHTGFEVMWDLAVNATKAGANLVLSAAEGGINKVLQLAFHAREMVPAAFAAMWDAAKQATEGALNSMISTVESAINRMISAANRVPNVNIDPVSIGRVSMGGGNPARHFSGARQRAQDAYERRRQDYGRLDTEGVGSIRDRASSRLADRFESIRQREKALKERFAASEIQFTQDSSDSGGSSTSAQPETSGVLDDSRAARQRATRSGPQPTQPQQQVEDNSVTIEEFRVEQQSTGDSELDGEQAGRAAMNYIEEQRNRRR